MTNLKEIDFGLNQYCGPSVLSALTGKTTDECAAVISKINGQQFITAVKMEHLMKAFEMLRFNVEKQKVFGSTLYASLVSLYRHEGFYVILIPRHVVAVEVTDKDIFLVDNHSKQPLNATQSARLLQKVHEVYKVTPKPEPKLIKFEYRHELIRNKSIRIWRYDFFDIEEHNTSKQICNIQYDTNNDLSSIIDIISRMHMSQGM